MPVSDRPLSLRLYSLWVGIGALLTISAIATLNIFVDPLGRFGFAYQFPFNAHYSSVAALNLRTLYPDPYLQSMGKRHAKTYLLGTSRFMVGFNTCDFSQSQKVSLGGADLNRLAQAQRILLSHARQPTTVFTEVAELNTDQEQHAPSTLSFFLKDDDLLVSLFGKLTTVASLKTVVLNLTTPSIHEATPDCKEQSVPFHIQPKKKKEKRNTANDHENEFLKLLSLFHETWNELISSIFHIQTKNAPKRKTAAATDDNSPLLRKAWSEAISSVEEICHRQGIRHKINWIILPQTANYWKRPLQQETLRQLQQSYETAIKSVRPYAGACDISLTSFIPEPNNPDLKLWQQKELWEDYIHFSPVLGALVLKNIIGTSAQRP